MTPRTHSHRCAVRSSTRWTVPQRTTPAPTRRTAAAVPTFRDVLRFRVARVGWSVAQWQSYAALLLALFAVGVAVMVGVAS